MPIRLTALTQAATQKQKKQPLVVSVVTRTHEVGPVVSLPVPPEAAEPLAKQLGLVDRFKTWLRRIFYADR